MVASLGGPPATPAPCMAARPRRIPRRQLTQPRWRGLTARGGGGGGGWYSSLLSSLSPPTVHSINFPLRPRQPLGPPVEPHRHHSTRHRGGPHRRARRRSGRGRGRGGLGRGRGRLRRRRCHRTGRLPSLPPSPSAAAALAGRDLRHATAVRRQPRREADEARGAGGVQTPTRWRRDGRGRGQLSQGRLGTHTRRRSRRRCPTPPVSVDPRNHGPNRERVPLGDLDRHHRAP